MISLIISLSTYSLEPESLQVLSLYSRNLEPQVPSRNPLQHWFLFCSAVFSTTAPTVSRTYLQYNTRNTVRAFTLHGVHGTLVPKRPFHVAIEGLFVHYNRLPYCVRGPAILYDFWSMMEPRFYVETRDKSYLNDCVGQALIWFCDVTSFIIRMLKDARTNPIQKRSQTTALDFAMTYETSTYLQTD